MQVVRFKGEKLNFSNPIITIGNFDGVHLGHKELLKILKKRAESIQGTSIVYTFDPHPAKVLEPEKEILLINSLEEKIILIENQGIEVMVIQPFEREFSNFSAEVFFRDILIKKLNVKEIIVGGNFAFGKAREADVNFLKKNCEKFNLKLQVVPLFKIHHEIPSSSKIREYIKKGEVKKASLFLGRDYFLTGVVIKGAGRGKKIGFPTANLFSKAELRPAEGVYLSLVDYQNVIYRSLTNIGTNPTFQSEKAISIETHILDFDKDIYGEKLIVYFLEKIRDERKFNSVDELIAQIKNDVKAARKFFELI